MHSKTKEQPQSDLAQMAMPVRMGKIAIEMVHRGAKDQTHPTNSQHRHSTASSIWVKIDLVQVEHPGKESVEHQELVWNAMATGEDAGAEIRCRCHLIAGVEVKVQA